MKARLLLSALLGLVLSAAVWLMYSWVHNSGQALPFASASLPTANNPAFSDWKRLWAEHNPEPNLLALAPTDQLVRANLGSSPASPPPAPIATAVAGSSTQDMVEAKLDQILAKLEQVEKRLEALDKRRQADTLEKLERLLERVNQLESRLQKAEQGDKTQATSNPFGWLLDMLFMNFVSTDPNHRIKELLNDSFSSELIGQDEGKQIRKPDSPSHLTPNRVDGAIQ